MNKTFFVATSILILLVQSNALSQTQEPPRYEIAAEFSSLGRSEFGGQRSDPGVGGRFTFNFNKTFALEVAAHGSFGECSTCTERGRVYDAFAGVKAGKRFKNWGIFAKVRPGSVNYGQEQLTITPTGTGGSFPFEIKSKGVDHFALDVGGVVEFYPTRRIVTRFDLGDTIIHFTQRSSDGISYDPVTQTYTVVPFVMPSRTTNNFQFIASVGFRF